MDRTELARRIFADDTFATRQTGIKIDTVDSDSCICSLAVDARHRNAKGAVMGGVLFTLADFAFAVAANSEALPPEQNTEEPLLEWVSSSSTIHFINAVKGDVLSASASCIKKGRLQALYQITITDNRDTKVALITTTGTRVQKK